MPVLRSRPVVLLIRDGWGQCDRKNDNAVYLARTPVEDKLQQTYPHVLIKTSGRDVGLPAGIMGNSEVGHQNIGAGRVVAQEAVRISEAIESGEFFKNPRLVAAVEHAKKNNGKLHLWGLCSNGVVHSMMEDVVALIDMAARHKLSRVFVHAMTDGRDTAPHAGIGYIGELEGAMKKHGVGRIATVIGRYHGMDRDRRWDRTLKAWNAMVHGKSDHVAGSAKEAVLHAYDKNVTDEFIEPTVIVENGKPVATIDDGDSVLCFNFRGDRPRQLTWAFVEEKFDGFDRGRRPTVFYTAMTEYHQSLQKYAAFLKPAKMKSIYGEYVAGHDLKQFRCAETEKFPHVTFFFDDYRDPPAQPEAGVLAAGPFAGEDIIMLQSPKGADVPTYDYKPEMNAAGVTDAVIAGLKSGKYDTMIVNFANPDMVGHTGVLAAAVKAVETVDECQGRIIEQVREMGGSLVITADHGNCEQMIDDETGGPHTAHTTNPVRLYVADERLRGKALREGGRLADIAPTMIELLGLPVPPDMGGKSLLPGR